ncbi:MAG: hypothetical protein H6591_10695 [Flavobacteriales bacterium]|nr:hypothetical protein [Flavobacteriales bacterium]
MAPDAVDREQAWAARWGVLVIALAVALTYWPLASFQWTVAHGDTLNCWLPWRWFISDCLKSGQLPLWNPHQQFGYPMHADLQGPSGYIEALALGGTLGHGVHVLQGLYLLYLMIGGWGMARLIRSLHHDARIGLVIGTAYALGGFLTGHQQHFYTIISAAWLPWLLDAFLHLLREPGWRPAARVALFQGLLLTGGNHTFTIIAAYLLLALTIQQAWRTSRGAGMRGLAPLVRWAGLAVLAAALIGALPLHALWETRGLLARDGALDLQAASVGALTRPSLLSLFFPFATGSDMERLGTDPPMSNAYMGALILAFALAALLRKRSAVENLLLVFGAVCALAAFGDATPMHRGLWRWLPGMDLFRFPAYFRWFTWLAVLVLAAGTLKAWWGAALERWKLIIPIAVVLGAAAVVALSAEPEPLASGSPVSLFERMRAMDLRDRVWLGAAVSMPLLLIVLVLGGTKRLGFAVVLLSVVVEMGWNSSLAQWNTALSDIRPSWLSHRLSALSEGPAIPRAEPMSRYDDSGARLHYLAHNTQDFLGGFSRNGVNSFWLRNAMDLEVSHAALWEAMARQPIAYLAERIIPWHGYDPRAVHAERDSGLVVLMPGSTSEAARARGPADQVEVIGFERDAFRMRCSVRDTALLVLQQSHYPGWEARIDGLASPIRLVNIAAMSVVVPAGEHEVLFRYRKPIVPWLLGLSLTSFFALLLALAVEPPRALPIGAVALLLSMTLWSLFAHERPRPRAERWMKRSVADLPDNASVILNDDGTSPMPTAGDMVGWRLRANEARDVGTAWAVLQAAARHRTERAPATERALHWFDVALKAHPAVRAMILDHYATEMVSTDARGTHLVLRPKPEPAPWTVLHAVDTSARHWLTAADPFGSGCRIVLDSLRGARDGALVIDLQASAPRPADAVVVVERRLGERTTEYRALPIRVHGPTEAPCYAVQPVDELYRPGEELRIYLWSNQGDSLQERGFRVRAADRCFESW